MLLCSYVLSFRTHEFDGVDDDDHHNMMIIVMIMVMVTIVTDFKLILNCSLLYKIFKAYSGKYAISLA